MEIEAKLNGLAKVVRDHKEVLLTEEAAKNALVMPFIQALGYDVFNPGEVIPEYTCDVGTKKGEKVDYAINIDNQPVILMECKPAGSDLSIKHAAQLFRYFSTSEARLAILTNGVVYKFYSDIDTPNKMDDLPFFSFSLENIRKADFKILAKFCKCDFDIENITSEARKLKLEKLVKQSLLSEMREPSDDFIRLIANKAELGRLKPSLKETLLSVIPKSFDDLVKNKVNERLTDALYASDPLDEQEEQVDKCDGIETTEVEKEGYNIVKAIGSRLVAPSRICIRDAKSYCAVLLDDNNRKTIARLHFNSETTRYLGILSGKDETRIQIESVNDIYQHENLIIERIKELEA